MAFAVELYMDRRADTAVREIWQSLAQAGIPSQPLSAGARPHVSLCLYESLDPNLFRKELEAFASQATPLDLPPPLSLLSSGTLEASLHSRAGTFIRSGRPSHCGFAKRQVAHPRTVHSNWPN